MGTTLNIATPADFDLPRDVCSYGYFVLAPNRWDVQSQSLTRPLNLHDGPAKASITQPAKGRLRAGFDRPLSRSEQAQARAKIARMLRLDEAEDHTKAFHRADPRWKRSGRSRLFRSPTLFEDIVKTVTSCNVTWPGTVNMNTQLVRHLGRKGCFPTPVRLARTRPGTLRGRCRVGYRDQRLIELANLFHTGHIDEHWLQSPATPDDDVFDFLKTLPGIGPYAAGNILMLLGRYSRLAIDTETIRHGKAVLGFTGSDQQITTQLNAHYEPFGPFKFKSYWFELWTHYETKQGPSHLWKREETATAFTANNL